MYASAQPLDFLARARPGPDPGTKNPSFPNWKLQVSHKMKFFYVDPAFPDGRHKLIRFRRQSGKVPGRTKA